jgi:hypothetical protein
MLRNFLEKIVEFFKLNFYGENFSAFFLFDEKLLNLFGGPGNNLERGNVVTRLFGEIQ